jgi:hypothetical protein
MALKKTQDKRGHLRGTSTNDVAKTGRGSGFTQVQGGKIGNHRGVSTNTESGKSTRSVPKETQSTRGATRNGKAGQDASRIKDDISSIG